MQLNRNIKEKGTNSVSIDSSLIESTTAARSRLHPNMFIVFATTPFHLKPQQHAFIGVNPSYVKILQNIHTLPILIQNISVLEIEFYVLTSLNVASVSRQVLSFLRSVSGGNMTILRSLIKACVKSRDIYTNERGCFLGRRNTISESSFSVQPIPIPQNCRRVLGKSLDRLATAAALILKCASVLCVGHDELLCFQLFFLIMIYPLPNQIVVAGEDGRQNYSPLLDSIEELINFDLLETSDAPTTTASDTPLDKAYYQLRWFETDKVFIEKLFTMHLRFKNGVVKEIAYRRMLQSQKKKLHKNLLEVLENLTPRTGLPPSLQRSLDFIKLKHAKAADDQTTTAFV
eukprot:snap_masked-scaffold_43-processed-gene-1.100-mRNA-1 protein AED:1.00 eAED:1.00 QI:0/0/0/0/1/1/2/0/344